MVTPDPRKVFVVHGRNEPLAVSMFSFLRAIGLHPFGWHEAIALTDHASPFAGDILDAAFAHAHAVVVLLTPDEVAYLHSDYSQGDSDPQTLPAQQARPNVLFEAGMALGRLPRRTLFVQVGEVRKFTDIAGRQTLLLDNTLEKRMLLADRLEAIACPVSRSSGWNKTGDFTAPAHPGALPPAPPVVAPATESVATVSKTELPHDLVAVSPGTVRVLDPHTGTMQELAIDYHFAIGALPVTQHFYASIMGSNPSHFVGDDRRPVENVTWYDAVEFCNALSTLEGLEPTYTRAYERAVPDLNPKATGYRLPTEAEWVFACMGGQTGDPYPADLPLSAWYKNTARGSTQPVGDLAANGLGIHDMLGNVEEWCQDFFGTRFVPSGPLEHPPRGPRRTRRGGSWVDKAQVVTAESRSSLFPARCDRFTGFRLARSIPN